MRHFKFKSAIVVVSVIGALGFFPAHAKLSIVTTTTDLKSLVKEVGGEWVTVDAIAKGTQDPHYVEAKPSFMSKVSRADLVIARGLDLEVGWLPSIVNGARNPKVNPGSTGYLEIGPSVDPIDVPQGKVTRAEGDVHPFGNPHFNLDPLRMAAAAGIVAERLGQIDPPHATQYLEAAQALRKRLEEKTKAWKARIEKTGVKKIITYHKTLNYFFARFQIENPVTLEPKPGIPPTSGHILNVIRIIKDQNVPLILVENFFDPTVTKRIQQEVPTIRSAVVPVEVEGAPGINTLDDLYETLVSAVEGGRK